MYIGFYKHHRKDFPNFLGNKTVLFFLLLPFFLSKVSKMLTLEVQGLHPRATHKIMQISQYIKEKTHQSLIFLSTANI